jgi:hypothetical protein
MKVLVHTHDDQVYVSSVGSRARDRHGGDETRALEELASRLGITDYLIVDSSELPPDTTPAAGNVADGPNANANRSKWRISGGRVIVLP